MDAAWEGPRVYVPQRVHRDFVGYRNHANAEQELLAWYERVSEDWTTGSRKGDALDIDMVRFWKARYAEEWPPAAASPSSKWEANLPPWAQKARAAKGAQ